MEINVKEINVKCSNGHKNTIKIIPPCKFPIHFCIKCHVKMIAPINFGGSSKKDIDNGNEIDGIEITGTESPFEE